MAGSLGIGAMAYMTSAGAVRGTVDPGKAGLVGAEGFEPPTLCSQSRCATRLRHAPTRGIVRRHTRQVNLPEPTHAYVRRPSQICFIYATVVIP